MNKVSSREDMIMTNIINFYKKKDNLFKLLTLLNKESKISLRLLDWFIVTYTKKNKQIQLNGNDTYEELHIQYKLELAAYRKRFFDPFCRDKRIKFYYDEESHIITTIGQLNFIRWIIETKIINLIENNYKKLVIIMNKSIKNNKNNKNKNNKNNVLINKNNKSINKNNTLINITKSNMIKLNMIKSIMEN
jgi:hypothetical protein